MLYNWTKLLIEVKLKDSLCQCPKEEETGDNLIVKDYCFIIETFLRAC